VKNPDPLLYVVRDTTNDLREVASYTADEVEFPSEHPLAVFTLGGKLVAVLHIAPGQSIEPVWEDEDDAEDIEFTSAGSIINGVDIPHELP
jgi:hypothetical protein